MIKTTIIKHNTETSLIREIERGLSPYFVEMRFKAGQILWNEGETAGKMISIITGKVKIFRPLLNGKQAAIYIFGAGDTFGFLPFIDGSPYPASAEVVEDVQALVMTREKLHNALKQDPEIAIFLLSLLGKRLRSAFDQIERLSTRGVIPRTASALISLSVQPGGGRNPEIISLIILVLSFAFAMLGLGGAMLYIPVFHWFAFDFKSVAIPTGLLLNGITALSASVYYLKEKMVDIRGAIPLVITSFIGPAGHEIKILNFGNPPVVPIGFFFSRNQSNKAPSFLSPSFCSHLKPVRLNIDCPSNAESPFSGR